MSALGSDLPKAGRSKPDIAEILRPRPDEEADQSGTAGAALVAAPVLVIGAIALTFIAFPIAIVLLVLAPGVASLGWLPGASSKRAGGVALATAITIGVAVALLGFQANRCVADPASVGLTGGTFMAGSFVVATAVGRAAAMDGHRMTPILAAGAVALLGFGGTLAFVITNVFALC